MLAAGRRSMIDDVRIIEKLRLSQPSTAEILMRTSTGPPPTAMRAVAARVRSRGLLSVVDQSAARAANRRRSLAVLGAAARRWQCRQPRQQQRQHPSIERCILGLARQQWAANPPRELPVFA